MAIWSHFQFVRYLQGTCLQVQASEVTHVYCHVLQVQWTSASVSMHILGCVLGSVHAEQGCFPATSPGCKAQLQDVASNNTARKGGCTSKRGREGHGPYCILSKPRPSAEADLSRHGQGHTSLGLDSGPASHNLALQTYERQDCSEQTRQQQQLKGKHGKSA